MQKVPILLESFFVLNRPLVIYQARIGMKDLLASVAVVDVLVMALRGLVLQVTVRLSRRWAPG